MTKKVENKTTPLTEIEFAALHFHIEGALQGKTLAADEAIFLIGIITSAVQLPKT